MSLRAPTVEETQELLAEMGIRVSESEAETYRDLVEGTLATYARTEELAGPNALRPDDYRGREVHGRVDDEADPLNAWVRSCRIEGDDDGLLAGLEVGVKDNVSVAGVPMTCGSRLLRGYVPEGDATVVTRMLDAGATIVGVLNMDSFAFSGVGDTSDYGPMRNPRDPEHYAGGSSGGSAAAVAAGDVDIALGGDQGGSVRIPAAWSGCVGHKPTHGLVPYTGIHRVDNTIDHVGPLARSVETVAACLEAVAGADPLDPRQGDVERTAYTEQLDRDPADLTVGVLSEGFGLDPSEAVVDEAVRDAVDVFADAGATVEEVSVPMHADAMAIWLPIIVQGAAKTLEAAGEGYGWEGYHDTSLVETLGKFQRASADEFSFNVQMAGLIASYLDERYHGWFYATAQNLRRQLTAAYDEVLEDVDVLALPTTPQRAFEHDPERPDAEVFSHALLPAVNTCAFNATGHPAISVPCATADGLPIGLMLVGDHFDDETVLAAAHAFEQRADWETR